MQSTVSEPNVTVAKLPAQIPAGVESQKILVIGQKTSDGSAVAGNLNEGISSGDVKTLFGKNSILTGTLEPGFKVIKDSQGDVAPTVDAIALDDAGAGVQATATITFADTGSTGLISETATIGFNIAGRDYSLDIIEGENIADIGAKLETVATDENAPFTVAEASNVVTATFINKGTAGNSAPLVATGLVNNIVGNVSVALTAFSGGATNPAVDSVLDVVGDKRYQTIIAPLEYGTDYMLDDFLDTRFNVVNDILDGVAIFTSVDTLSNHKTALAGLNSQSCVYITDKVNATDDYKGGSLRKMPYEVSAIFGFIRSLRLTEGANVLNITPGSTYGAKDGLGGFHMRSLPYFNTELNDIDPILTNKGFSKLEMSEINEAGGTVLGNNTVGNGVIIGETRTTYKTDSAGNEDTTWRFLNTVDSMSGCAEYIYRNLKKRFVQSRFTAGTLKQGYSECNEGSVKGYAKELYIDCGEQRVAVSGKEASDFFYQSLVTEVDYVEGSMDIIADFPIVSQLRKLYAALRTKFGL